MALVTRRTLLIGTAAAGAGLAVGYAWVRRPWPNPLDGKLAADEVALNPYIKISSNGQITIITPRAEMGQGAQTGLAQLVAEELDVPLQAVNVEHGPAGKAYLNWELLPMSLPFPEDDKGMIASSARGLMRALSHVFGHQVTGGSTAIVDAFDGMRMAGATARAMLIAAAAARLGKNASTFSTANGHVVTGGESIPYAALAREAAKLAPSDDVKLKLKADWRLIGKDAPRVELKEKLTGAPIFGVDVSLPDMLYATVRMNPHLGAGMTGLDASAAKAMPGVMDVIELSGPDGGGFAVIADNTWRAIQAAVAVKPTWAQPAYTSSSDNMFADLAAALDTESGYAFRDDGDADGTLHSSKGVIEAEYRVPFLAHTTMEPMNATAQLTDGKLTLWLGTQVPTMVVDMASREFGISPENCELNTTFLGGGFGRRLEIDFARYAVLVAKAAEGRPVKVTWSREEDTTHDMYRPMAIGRFRGVIGPDGIPTAISARIAAPSVARSYLSRVLPNLPAAGPDRLIAEGVFDQPYTLPHYRVEGVMGNLGVPVGNWRSVGNSYGAFFHETFLDELARAGNIDPVAMRLTLMEKHSSERKVVEKVAAMCSWGGPQTAGTGRGIAATRSFGSMVAEVVEVRETPEGLRVAKVWAAIDVGTAVNPALIRAQVESAIAYGLSAAIMQEITIKDGKVEQSNFHDFPALRINQMPEVEVAVLENQDHIGGVGEPGLPPVIPALGNAIFQMTGKRIRTLPFNKSVAFAS